MAGVFLFPRVVVGWDVVAGQLVRGRGSWTRRAKAVASCFAQGQVDAMRSRVCLADLVILAATCRSR